MKPQYTFDELFSDETRRGTKIPASEYKTKGKYPIIDQGKRTIAGYIDEPEGLFTDVPAIIFGDHTRIVKYVDVPFFIGADGVKILSVKKAEDNSKYFYYALKNARIPDTGYNRHFKWLREQSFLRPAIDEQNIIVRRLDAMLRFINNTESQLAKLDTLVKSRFIEMFGDPVTNPYGYPIYLLSDISSSRLGKMLDRKKQTGENSHPYLANYNVQWFRFELGNLNKMDFDEADRQEFELKKGDLLVCEGGEVGRCAIWNNEMEGCYFQKAIHRVRCNPEYIIPEYLGYTFFWHSQYNGFSDAISGVSTIAHLPGDRLKKLQIIVPPLDLQHRFAEFIHLADKSKSVLQKLLEKQELLRAALMQEYFG